MVISYSSPSLILLGDNRPFRLSYGDFREVHAPQTRISGFAVIVLGVGVLGQSFIATCCVRSHTSIPTWSSSPLDTTAACLSLDSHRLRHHSRRCMRSVHEIAQSAEPIRPKKVQKVAYDAHKEIRRILLLIWFLDFICALWGVALTSGSFLPTMEQCMHQYPGASTTHATTTQCTTGPPPAPPDQEDMG